MAAPVPPLNLIANRKRAAAALPTQQAGLASHAPVFRSAAVAKHGGVGAAAALVEPFVSIPSGNHRCRAALGGR
eukprot:15425854-Alexandrium_andersonii.AAC.1